MNRKILVVSSRLRINYLPLYNNPSLILYFRTFFKLHLQHEAFKCMLKNFQIILTDYKQLFLDLEFEDALGYLNSAFLNSYSEETVWEAAMQWILHKEERLDHIAEMMGTVRIGLLSSEVFLNKVKSNALVERSGAFQDAVNEAIR